MSERKTGAGVPHPGTCFLVLTPSKKWKKYKMTKKWKIINEKITIKKQACRAAKGKEWGRRNGDVAYLPWRTDERP